MNYELYNINSLRINQDSKTLIVLVVREGIEPSRPCGHSILSAARIPVPPPDHSIFLLNVLP
jgi:hypothetical protein